MANASARKLSVRPKRKPGGTKVRVEEAATEADAPAAADTVPSAAVVAETSKSKVAGPARGADGKFVSPGAKAKGKPKLTLTPIDLVRRVYGTIGIELTKLENQEGLESQDRERASRALSQIVNSLNKASRMHREISNASAKGAKKSDTEALRHADDMRRQIADRIERLVRERGTGKPAG
ncbi:MAG: hypothetical protein ACT4OU_06330 [Hyphomicrobium sp.]